MPNNLNPRKLLEILSKQAESAGESMEKLSIAELAIYSGLVVKDLAMFKLPSAVVFANMAESVVEWLTNKMISASEGDQSKQLGPVFETIGNIASTICGVKDDHGRAVQGSKALIQNKDKVTGALITAMNSLGMLNSLNVFGSGLWGARAAAKVKPKAVKGNRLGSLAGIIAPGFNTVSMLVCSVLKDHFSKLINLVPGQKSEHHQKLSASLSTSSKEDSRCAMKSLLAMIVDTLDFFKLPGAKLIDGIGGIALNAFGIRNGLNGLKGAQEEEAGPSINVSEMPMASSLLELGKQYLKLTGVNLGEIHKVQAA